jgi:hypothetical protein
MTRRRRRLGGVMVVAAPVLVALVIAGSGPLAAPPTGSWSAVEAWYREAGPATGAVVVLRLMAMLGCTWLLVAASLQLAASASPLHDLQRLADTVSPLVLQRVSHGVASLSVTAGLAVPSVAAMPQDDPPGTAVMEVVEEPGATTTTAPPTPAAPVIPVPAPAPASVEDEIVVEVGDSFWSLAVDVLSDVHGAHPGDREVAAYWRRLVDANRSRLVDPANPDLIFPAQTLTLPTP